MKGSIVPFEGVYPRHVAATRDEERHTNSRIGLTDVWASLYQAIGYKLEKIDDGKGDKKYKIVEEGGMKGKAPPAPAAGYQEADISNYLTSNGMDVHEILYSMLHKTAEEHGYKVIVLPKDEMLTRYNTIGCEIDDMIYLADGLDWKKASQVLGHELDAKLRKEEDPSFDHAKEHRMERYKYDELTGDGGADLVKEYALRAELIKRILDAQRN